MSAQAIVFLHGWTMCGKVFDDQCARLSGSFTCLAPDMPGHCSAADQPLTFRHAADMVNSVLHARGISRVLLVGWSMGAVIAWEYIRQYGTDRLAGLVTLDMSPRVQNDSDWPHGLLGQSAQDIATSTERMHDDWPGMVGAIAATMFSRRPDRDPPKRDWAFQTIMTHDPDKMRSLWHQLLESDYRDVIPSIDVPYRAGYGGQSRVYPASAAQWLADTAPRGKTVNFSLSGHSPHLEEPDRFEQVIRAFAHTL